MRNTLKILGVSIMVLTVSVAMVAVASDLPEEITIPSCGDKKGPVTFPHTAHFEFGSCTDCHHTSEGLTLETAAEMTVETCASCHADPEEGVPDCAQMSTKKNPYHISCIGCHKDMKKEAAEDAEFKAPIMCNDCHVKVED